MSKLPSTSGKPSWSLREWCEREGMSNSMFYKLRNEGKGPDVYHVGTLVRISAAADAKWRKAREHEASQERKSV